MNNRKISMKWRIFLYIALFSAMILSLLWVFQTVFLDSFYKTVKLRRADFAMQTVRTVLESTDPDALPDRIQTISEDYDVCLSVYDSRFLPVAVGDSLPNCSLHRMGGFELRQLYLLAVENGGSYVMRWGDEYHIRVEIGDGSYYEFQMLPQLREEDRVIESIISTEIVTTSEGAEYIVFLNSVISPVGETVYTLRIQLLYVSLILLVMAALFALVISTRLTKPLRNMNAAARQLATGDYGIHFENSSGYQEIDRLGDTLNYAAKELSRADALRKDLLANISHDLRTPLTMITGYGEMMRDIPGENTGENIGVIVREAKRLSELVDDALSISKLQAGGERPHPSVFSITSAVSDIVTRIAGMMRSQGYSLAFESAADILVSADEIKISQVVYNLINNALSHSGGQKTVFVRQIEDQNTVRIEVVDSGPGIREEDLPHIFDRYYQGEPQKRADVGTGLGLAIVKAILEMHGFEYGVSSSLGRGSIFWFRLPITRREPPETP